MQPLNVSMVVFSGYNTVPTYHILYFLPSSVPSGLHTHLLTETVGSLRSAACHKQQTFSDIETKRIIISLQGCNVGCELHEIEDAPAWAMSSYQSPKP